MTMQQTVSVTGVTGFIGRHVVPRLVERGLKVKILLRPSSKSSDLFDGVSKYEGDITDPDSIDECFWQSDCLIHLAYSGTPQIGSAKDHIEQNLIPLIEIIERVRGNPSPRIVFISSAAVYGASDVSKFAESEPARPISSYGVIKAACENFLLAAAAKGHLRPCILRLSNPYGPGQLPGPQGVIANFFNKIESGCSIDIYGDGNAVRDFVYIDDVASAIVTACVKSTQGVYNIGSGTGTSINDLARRVAATIGKTAIIKRKPARSQEIKTMIFDTECSERHLNWTASRQLNAGLREYWFWLKAQMP